MRGHALDRVIIVAREIADIGPLDLDHARAEVRKLAGGERRRNCMLERNYCDAIEGSHVSCREKESSWYNGRKEGLKMRGNRSVIGEWRASSRAGLALPAKGLPFAFLLLAFLPSSLFVFALNLTNTVFVFSILLLPVA
jgi:hypothetical protein